MSAILASVIGALATAILGLIGAVLLGKLVPLGHLRKAEQESEKWRLAYEDMRAAKEDLAKVVDRQQIVAEATNAVLNAVKQGALGQAASGGNP